jgi:hypothetical protein
MEKNIRHRQLVGVMPVDVGIVEAYTGVRASNAVGKPNPGAIGEHPAEYIFQKFVEIANAAGVALNVGDCFSPDAQSNQYSSMTAQLDDVKIEQVFNKYTQLYSNAIDKLLETIKKDTDDYSDFRCEMFNELHENGQFLRLCGFLLPTTEERNLFETELRDVDEWLFDGCELEDEYGSKNDDPADDYLVNGASPPCDALRVYLAGDPLYSLIDRWTMSTIESGSWNVCSDKKSNRESSTKDCVVIQKIDDNWGHHGNDGTSHPKEVGTRQECEDWGRDNNPSPGTRYEIIDRYIIEPERIVILEEYHPSLVLCRLHRISNALRNLHLFHVEFLLKNWLDFGPATGDSFMMMRSGQDDKGPKIPENTASFYRNPGSNQFVCKLRPGRWSNELNTLDDAISELPAGYDLAILLWSHSVNPDFTDSIRTNLSLNLGGGRIAGIVHYDNKGTYISEHSYTANGWIKVDQNPEHKGTIEGFN